MSGYKNVVVLGGSGNLGTPVVEQLLSAGLTVTATTRPGSSSNFPSGVRVVETDFSKTSLVSIFKRNDVVVSLVGPALLPKQADHIDAAVEAGIKRYFPSEFGSETRGLSQDMYDSIPLFGWKLDAVAHLKTKEKEGLTWTAIISGPFFDWGLRMGFLDFDPAKKTAGIWDSGNNKVYMTNCTTIGKTIANIITSSELLDATANQYVETASHVVSQNEILAAVEELTGDKWTVTKKDAAVQSANAKVAMKAGNPYAVYDLIKALAFGDPHGEVPEVKLWNEKLGLPKEDLKEDLKKWLA